MAGIFEREPKSKWPRSQKFRLSPKGVEAEASYRAVIVAARAESGRAAFDAARTSWAKALAVEPGDGAYLVELQAGERTVDELTKSLESCGATRPEVRAALGRLTDAGVVEAVPPPAPPPPPMRRLY